MSKETILKSTIRQMVKEEISSPKRRRLNESNNLSLQKVQSYIKKLNPNFITSMKIVNYSGADDGKTLYIKSKVDGKPWNVSIDRQDGEWALIDLKTGWSAEINSLKDLDQFFK